MKAIGEYVLQQEQLGQRTNVCKNKNNLQQELTIKTVNKKQLGQKYKTLSLARGHSKLINLRHVNLSQHRDYKESHHNIYLISEYAQGRDLVEIVRQRDTLSQTLAQQIVQGLVACLSYLQENNVYHYDVKPNNILVNEEGEVKVLNLFSSLIDNHCKGLHGEFSEDSYVWTVGSIYNFCLSGIMKSNSYRGDDVAISFLQMSVNIRTTWRDICQHPLITNHHTTATTTQESIIICRKVGQTSEISYLTNSDCDQFEHQLSQLLDELEETQNGGLMKTFSRMYLQSFLERDVEKLKCLQSEMSGSQGEVSTQYSTQLKGVMGQKWPSFISDQLVQKINQSSVMRI